MQSMVLRTRTPALVKPVTVSLLAQHGSGKHSALWRLWVMAQGCELVSSRPRGCCAGAAPHGFPAANRRTEAELLRCGGRVHHDGPGDTAIRGVGQCVGLRVRACSVAHALHSSPTTGVETHRHLAEQLLH